MIGDLISITGGIALLVFAYFSPSYKTKWLTIAGGVSFIVLGFLRIFD